ncbi:F-box/LRR-repeat protein [Actinidia chinensis var. chinensis]|uniref:F-box/LRR-repeat protein n=1 Tax=Actinidia chinensis var. chinensis TaxID=1590841 RepID=A0A2R6P6J9_ACTCC|nr:F-box/LRR-repeat protein [Actinidia chinensis var. chinensis]
MDDSPKLLHLPHQPILIKEVVERSTLYKVEMETDFINGPTSIMPLPNECLYFIFQLLDCGSCLTYHRWLYIQNSSSQSLQFECSFSVLNTSSLSRTSTTISPFRLYRLLDRFLRLQMVSLSGYMDLPDSSLTLLQYYALRWKLFT